MRRLAALVSVGLLGQVAIPLPPTPEPVFELHRTVRSAHVDPLKRNPLFVLVLGSDIREGDPARGRADSIHIVAVNTKTGKGTIVGIPRDALVGGRKINAYLVFGGPKRMVSVVEQISGLPIHYWALTEFSGFRKLVDRVGGLEVNVPYDMADRASGAFFAKGKKKMNGAQVLAFTRARKTIPGGDFGRSENHGRVLLAALGKFGKDAGKPFGLVKYLQAFDLVRANVPASDLIHLAQVAWRLEPKNFRNVVVPAASSSSGGASVQILGAGAKRIFDEIRDDAVL